MDRQKKLDKKLMDSIASGYDTFEAVLRHVKNGADLHTRDPETGRTPLHHLFMVRNAMDTKAREVLSLCVERGVAINARDNEGLTPLHRAAYNFYETHGDQLREMVERYGADVRARSNNGRTPLHSACMGCGAVKELLALGAEANLADADGMTPLHYAASRGLSSAVGELLLQGGDPTLPNSAGETPADVAAKHEHFSLAVVLRNREREAKGGYWKPDRPQGPRDPWTLLGKDVISRTNDCAPAGYRITEIFNFSSRLYTQISTNLETKAEALAVKSFDEFADKRLLREALVETDRLHGEVDPGALHPPGMDKQLRPGLPKP